MSPSAFCLISSSTTTALSNCCTVTSRFLASFARISNAVSPIDIMNLAIVVSVSYLPASSPTRSLLQSKGPCLLYLAPLDLHNHRAVDANRLWTFTHLLELGQN